MQHRLVVSLHHPIENHSGLLSKCMTKVASASLTVRPVLCDQTGFAAKYNMQHDLIVYILGHSHATVKILLTKPLDLFKEMDIELKPPSSR